MRRQSSISFLFLSYKGQGQSFYSVWTGSSTHCNISALNYGGENFTLLGSIDGHAATSH